MKGDRIRSLLIIFVVTNNIDGFEKDALSQRKWLEPWGLYGVMQYVIKMFIYIYLFVCSIKKR